MSSTVRASKSNFAAAALGSWPESVYVPNLNAGKIRDQQLCTQMIIRCMKSEEADRIDKEKRR